MSETRESSRRESSTLGLDHIADDLFGLSLRGLHTLKDAIIRPARLFEAARTPDWNGEYTPSMRLFTSVIVFIMFLRFLWAGPESAIEQSFAIQLEALAEQYHPVFAEPETLERIMNLYMLIYPGAVVGCVFIAASLTFIWGKRSGWVSRVRLFYAAMLPNVTFSSLMIFVIGATRFNHLILALLVPLLLTLAIDFVTVFRGLRPVYDTGARIWRSGLFALITLLSLMAASLISQTVAGIWLGRELASEHSFERQADTPQDITPAQPDPAGEESPET